MTGSILAAMVNGAIVSSLLAAVVWLALRLTPRARLNAATRYAFWWAALAATLALPALYLPMPRHRAATPVRTSAAPTSAPEISPGLTIRFVSSPKPATTPSSRLPLNIPKPEWVAIAWLATSGLLLLRLVLSWLLLDRQSARASYFARAEKWLAVCRRSRANVRPATSAEIASPVAVGPRHPAILIPSRLAEDLSDEELGQIVLHEAAHLARRDDYALLVERVIEALFALHPVVRWITRQIDLEREVACDDFVVSTTGQARNYAACLTRMVELCGGVRPSLAGAMAASDRSHLARRVDRLLDAHRHMGTRLLRMRLAMMIAVLAASAWMAGRTPALVAFAMPTPAPQSAATPAPTAPAFLPRPVPTVVADAAPPPQRVSQVPPQPATPQTAPAPIGSAQVDAVRVVIPVTVTEPKGRFVTGLGRENFRLFDDGVEQQISVVSSSDTPVSVGILVDTSGSMRNKMASMQSAVLELLKSSRPQDEFFLMPFNDEAVLAVPFTNDTKAIETALLDITPRGGTAVRDAVHMALAQMTQAHNHRKAILVISDGDDNSSGRSIVDLRSELDTSDSQFYGITIADNPAAQRIHTTVGQTVILGIDASELRNATAQFAADLRNRYILEFTPGNPAPPGSYRRVHIELTPTAGLPPLTLRYAEGYYAPRR